MCVHASVKSSPGSLPDSPPLPPPPGVPPLPLPEPESTTAVMPLPPLPLPAIPLLDGAGHMHVAGNAPPLHVAVGACPVAHGLPVHAFFSPSVQAPVGGVAPGAIIMPVLSPPVSSSPPLLLHATEPISANANAHT